ncbi:MLR [Hepatospora eriocheir]|uniref:MLR n=1 Tax=Hepatospora eriocheir TaxID=1081669 RepID=A0A1X0QG77_9MICR|nr:MLR [Hepatospora eriocheir]
MIRKLNSKRTNSNVFHMLTEKQIRELRDAFNLIDTDNDGVISEKDFKIFTESIGSPFSENEMREMLDQISPTYNFMTFLSLIGDKLSNISSESDLISSFKMFDSNNSGTITKAQFLEIIDKDKYSQKEINILLKDCTTETKIDYTKLVQKIKHGEILE